MPDPERRHSDVAMISTGAGFLNVAKSPIFAVQKTFRFPEYHFRVNLRSLDTSPSEGAIIICR
jgi:hypothetical protein